MLVLNFSKDFVPSEKWIPLYSRVSFSQQPYNEALIAGNFQDEIMSQILKMENINTIWNSKEVEDKIIRLLESKTKNHF